MKITWKDIFKIGCGVLLLYICISYWPVAGKFLGKIVSASMPLLIGGIIAYFVNIIMDGFEKVYFPRSTKKFIKATRRPVCMILAFATVAALIAFVVGLVVPELVSCVQLILRGLPSLFTAFVEHAEKLEFIPDDAFAVIAEWDWQKWVGDAIKILSSGVGSLMSVVLKTVSSVFSGLVTALISIIFAVYLLSAKDKLKKQSKRFLKYYLKDIWCKKIIYAISVINDCFRRFFVGQCVEAGILGVLCTLGMLVLRLPYATMIGTLVGFTAIIPVAGSYIGAVIGSFLILLISPIKALVFLVFLVILQQLEGNIIYPRVVGSSIGLPALWVLAAVTVGGGIMGVFGMLLGVPIAAAVYRMFRDDMNGVSPLRTKSQLN